MTENPYKDLTLYRMFLDIRDALGLTNVELANHILQCLREIRASSTSDKNHGKKELPVSTKNIAGVFIKDLQNNTLRGTLSEIVDHIDRFLDFTQDLFPEFAEKFNVPALAEQMKQETNRLRQAKQDTKSSNSNFLIKIKSVIESWQKSLDASGDVNKISEALLLAKRSALTREQNEQSPYFERSELRIKLPSSENAVIPAFMCWLAKEGSVEHMIKALRTRHPVIPMEDLKAALEKLAEASKELARDYPERLPPEYRKTSRGR